jgi:hypothetical protein
MTLTEGHEGFFSIPRLTALSSSGGLVISRSYGRVKPAPSLFPVLTSRNQFHSSNNGLCGDFTVALLAPMVRPGPGGPPFRNSLK